MKNNALLLSLVVSVFSFGQSTPYSPAGVSSTGGIRPDTLSSQILPLLPDEGTNDPQLTGFIRHTVNGINYYYKKNEHMAIVFVEEKK